MAAVWSVVELRLNVATFVDGFANGVSFLKRSLPLDFPPLDEILVMTGQTLAIVVCSTLLSVIISIPIALMAAKNTTINHVTRGAARTAIVFARAVPDLVLAIIFLRIFGLGSLAGILALGLHSVGMVGKLYADAIEEVNEGPREAIRAAGGTKRQQITSGVFPLVMPAFIATALHRFDINLRTSVVLGFVGVGGIGLEIASALRTMNYRRGMALALLVLALCILTEVISGSIRTALLGRSKTRRTSLLGPVGSRLRSWAGGRSANWVEQPAGAQSRALRGRVSPPWNANRIRKAGYVILTGSIILASLKGADVTAAQVFEGLARIGPTLDLFLPPSTGGIFGTLLAAMVVTLQIALAATLIGAVFALPIGILAARNVAPTPRIAMFFRVVIVVVRGLPELIVAIIFVVITGLGPVAGALALSIGAIGLLGKLIADSIEETDVRVQEAVRASGAGERKVFIAATLRQSAPSIVAHLMYQLDVNIRSATLLGIVGAGGIGFYLANAARVMKFDVVTTVVLLILATVLLVEALAIWVRRVVS